MIQAGAILILAGWNGWQYIQKRRERALCEKYGLEANPKRCDEEKKAIESLRDCIEGRDGLRVKVEGLERDVSNIKDDIREIKGKIR
jgi:hypothetical protein